MIIDGKRRTMMREFIDTRIVKALEKNSQKILKNDETFLILFETDFSKIRQEVLTSMEEYFTYDFWNEKDLVQQYRKDEI